eukprot:3341576-Lingulodinium_polyedra.AAC.1
MTADEAEQRFESSLAGSEPATGAAHAAHLEGALLGTMGGEPTAPAAQGATATAAGFAPGQPS